MHSSRPIVSSVITVALTIVSSGMLSAAAQDAPPALDPASTPDVTPAAGQPPVPEARLRVGGIVEDRFNPTHGSVFFHVLGMDLADAGRDARVLVNDTPLSHGQTFPSPRIVGASFLLTPGLNRIEFTGWDALGRPLRTESRIWAGDLALEVLIKDLADDAPVEAAVSVTLEKQPSVSVEKFAERGRVLFADLPDERLRVVAQDITGRRATATVSARQGRLELRLR